MSELISIKLWFIDDEPINNSPSKTHTLIHEISEVLSTDENWHHFWEDLYNELRFSIEYMDKVFRLLLDRNVIFTYEGKWEDNDPTVELNKDIYTNLFHCFTLLSLQKPDEWSQELYTKANFDRIAHCFINHQYIPYLAECDNEAIEPDDTWESDIVSDYLVNRTWYNAQYDERRTSDENRKEDIDILLDEEKIVTDEWI